MIENQERVGWIATCPTCKHEFKATILKSWGGHWIVFRSNNRKYIYLDDFNESRDIKNYVSDKFFKDIFGSEQKLVTSDFSILNIEKCPSCLSDLNFEKNINSESVLWIDGEILIDGKTKNATKLSVIIE